MVVTQTLVCIAIVAPNSHLAMKFHLKCLHLKMSKFGNITSYALMHDNTYNHSCLYGMIECTIHEPVCAKTSAFPF